MLSVCNAVCMVKNMWEEEDAVKRSLLNTTRPLLGFLSFPSHQVVTNVFLVQLAYKTASCSQLLPGHTVQLCSTNMTGVYF